MPEVVVFDTNVLLSAIGWKGRPYECLEYVRSGAAEGVTCDEIINEFLEKLQTKLSFSQTEAVEIAADLLTFMRVVRISGTLRAVIADPDDDKVLECAVVGSATQIVTGDRRHLLPLGSFQRIPIITPADFVRIMSAKK